VFEFGKELLDSDQVWAVGWQEDELCASAPDKVSDDLGLVAAQVVHDHNIALPQCWQQNVTHIDQEAFAIDGSVEQPSRCDATGSQCGKEGQSFPVPVRGKAKQPLTLIT
jgi:hypothetical protein